ncbi:3-dehydroquinate synthase [Candidatus Peregrinibacteria bacterium CG10_big_fil_rev_8_21_14_0_10_36_19]|nr:MAG: 3-dehydroquinate synthase [Candidatus Peregrinibacteria bacterium CG10_big_fil_rev_8_21_14_0_10_36_19]
MALIKEIKLSTESYKIFINENIESFFKKNKIGQKYAIITDDKVKKLYAIKLKNELQKNKIEAEIFSFKNGEKQKTINTLETLANQMVEKGFDRKDAIIALGGGVVGDLAGFLASTYMRGIPYIQVPTTLLAMVDSSIGGKTGVDISSGKNLLGTFHQPQAVLINTNYLQTLSQQQIKNGVGEIIKYGVISSKQLFEYLEKNMQNILDLKEENINYIIKKSVIIKAEIVEQDEKESNIRMILNYGHTYGHAIEKISNYKLLHGYAVAIGMVIANKIAVEEKILKQTDSERIKNLIKLAGLPTTTLHKPKLKDLLSDKKKEGNFISFILPTKIGEAVIKKTQCQ